MSTAASVAAFESNEIGVHSKFNAPGGRTKSIIVKYLNGGSSVVRSRQKEMRRQGMLDAAEALIRETGSTDFSMLLLAERAGISAATPYNVFGSKVLILSALLVNSLDTIFLDFDKITRTMNPFEVVQFAAREATNFFIADPDYYRPLYLYLIGERDDLNRPAYLDRALGYWRSALGPLHETGHLQSAVERDALARSMMILFLGALNLWCQREISHDLFKAHITYGVSAVLCGIADESALVHLRKVMVQASQSMPQKFSFECAKVG